MKNSCFCKTRDQILLKKCSLLQARERAGKETCKLGTTLFPQVKQYSTTTSRGGEGGRQTVVVFSEPTLRGTAPWPPGVFYAAGLFHFRLKYNAVRSISHHHRATPVFFLPALLQKLHHHPRLRRSDDEHLHVSERVHALIGAGFQSPQRTH